MTIKNYLLIIIFFITILIILKKINRVNEHFKDSYISQRSGEYNFLSSIPQPIYPYGSKKITVQLTKNLINPLKIFYNPVSELQLSINKKIESLFPLTKKPSKKIINILEIINTKKNIITYLNEDIFIDKYLGINNKKLSNLRFVCGICYSHFTLITPLDSGIQDWTNLDNKIIGTIADSSSLMNLKYLLNILNYKKKKINISVVENNNDLQKLLLTSQIDAIYLTTEHPSLFIQSLSKNIKIRIITTKGIPQDKFQLSFPYISKQKIDLREYNTYQINNPLLDSYATRLLFISNKNTEEDYIYKFLESFFQNIQFIRFGIKPLSILTPMFSAFCYSSVNYQSGSEKFCIQNNYITYNNNNLCYLYAGTEKCNNSKINTNRFIQDNNNIDNYQTNFTILDPQGKWNNVVNDWDYKKGDGQRFKDDFTYNIQSKKPLLVSELSLMSDSNISFNNFKNQIKYSPNQLFPNL